MNTTAKILTSSNTDEWYTPVWLLERARELLGTIDLDPSSCVVAQANVRARTYFTKDDDGLSKRWYGQVWMNPPYSNAVDWLRKLDEEYESGRVTEALALVGSGSAFAKHMKRKHTWLEFNQRVQFHDINGKLQKSPTRDVYLIYLGHNRDAFVSTFADVGTAYASLR